LRRVNDDKINEVVRFLWLSAFDHRAPLRLTISSRSGGSESIEEYIRIIHPTSMIINSDSPFVWQELHGRLWHTTHPERFRDILIRGAILPEPDVPDGDRWKTGGGPALYPYVRSIGGVSLFDFDGFDRVRYSEQYPASSWAYFVPFRRDWGYAVWIEINRAQIAQRFVSGRDLVARQMQEKAHRHTIMPYIEAAYIGELPRAAFLRAIEFREGHGKAETLALS
jgi:hypothetical protein